MQRGVFMYEQLRSEVVVELSGKEMATVAEMLAVLDRVAEGYDITKKSICDAYRLEILPEAATIYLARKKMSGLSEETLENYQLILSLFFLIVKKPLEQITSNDLRMWLYAYQKSRNVSNRTLDKYRAIITRFFNWALDEGYICSNPARNVEAIRFEVKPRESLTQVQLEYLRMACKTPRDLAVIETLYSTGCRVSELAGLKKQDIDWRELTVHLFGKGKKHRFAFLNAKAEVALKKYLDSRHDDSEYIFVSVKTPHKPLHKDGIEKIIRDISKRATIGRNVTPHILRHTTATIALHNGMPIEAISKLLGHESIDTTMIYAKSSLEDVRAGHRKYIV